MARCKERRTREGGQRGGAVRRPCAPTLPTRMLHRSRARAAIFSFGFLGLALASLLFATPANAQIAQDKGSMQVGDATVTMGVGAALLTLPDIEFTTVVNNTLGPQPFLAKNKNQEIDREIGWNINGSFEIPTNGWPRGVVAIKGFYARIEDDDTLSCPGNRGIVPCAATALVDDPGAIGKVNFGFVGGAVMTDREVAHWGVALEAKGNLTPDVMGVARGPSRRNVAVGLDYRAIDQDVEIDGRPNPGATTNWDYDEDLDTRYAGVYAAYSQDGSVLPIIGNMLTRLGVESSFRVQGGVYYVDTDYDGRLTGGASIFPTALNSNLSLSEEDVAFIGGLTLSVKKRIGRRAQLSLQSVYEYYSWVPDMKYNDTDVRAIGAPLAGQNTVTSIGDDDAFSARWSIRLTIGLGPSDLYQ